MALTDVIFDTMSSEADRGNIGVLVDILDERWLTNQLTLDVPLTTEVQVGVTFGPQGSLTGVQPILPTPSQIAAAFWARAGRSLT